MEVTITHSSHKSGGQVVLPFLLEEVVTPGMLLHPSPLMRKGWMTEREFLNGFALAQALPGTVILE